MTAPTSHPNLRPAEAPAGSPVLWTLLPWLGIVLFLVAQYVLFRGYVERELAWRYPSNFDQAVYLTNSYEYYEAMRAEDLWNGLRHGFLQPTPNGALLEVGRRFNLLDQKVVRYARKRAASQGKGTSPVGTKTDSAD